MSAVQEVKEVYSDALKFRLSYEFWRMENDLMPQMLAGLEYVSEHKGIDDRWRATLEELAVVSLDLKYSIMGFTEVLTIDDQKKVRTFEKAMDDAKRRPGRKEVPRNVMEGRAEGDARRRLAIEDRAIALFLQLLDVRNVAFKNRLWDLTNRPQEKPHQL